MATILVREYTGCVRVNHSRGYADRHHDLAREGDGKDPVHSLDCLVEPGTSFGVPPPVASIVRTVVSVAVRLDELSDDFETGRILLGLIERPIVEIDYPSAGRAVRT